MRCRTDGRPGRDARTADPICDIPRPIETCSRGCTLHLGDVVATGTPGGVGMGFDPPRSLHPGNAGRIAIDAIGVLQNRCVEARKRSDGLRGRRPTRRRPRRPCRAAPARPVDPAVTFAGDTRARLAARTDLTGCAPQGEARRAAAHSGAGLVRRQSARIAAVLVLFAASLLLLRGVLPAIAWAGLAAVSTWPLHLRVARRLGDGRARHDASAALLTAVATVLLLLPLGWLAWRGALELPALLRVWRASNDSGLPAPAWLASVPVVGAWLLQQWNESLAQPGALGAALHGLVPGLGLHGGRILLGHVVHDAMLAFFSVLVLFFLYRDGDALAVQVETLLARQFGPPGERALQSAVQAVRGTVNGLVLVGLGLAAAMSVAYALAGVPHPALWGIGTGLVGIVPFGAAVVLSAAVLLLFTLGAGTAALLLGAFGAVLIFVTDHFVRPLFIAGASRLPLVLALLGIVAGLETFGVLGVFLGPTLLAVGTAVWRELVAPSADGVAGGPGVPLAAQADAADARPLRPPGG